MGATTTKLFPDCLGGTINSLQCLALEHSADCNRGRFEKGYGIWCREPTVRGPCAKLVGHHDQHRGINDRVRR